MTSHAPLQYSDDVECVPPDEAEQIRQVVLAMQTLLARSHEQSGKFRRDVHVKTHGCARGELCVAPDLPDELSQGLFVRPGVFPAIVRFSNASPSPQSDAVPDGRGLAIQVQDVVGEFLPGDDRPRKTQDFLMVNHPTFIVPAVCDYLRLEQVRLEAMQNPAAGLRDALTGGDWNPLNWHWNDALAAARAVSKFPAQLAHQRYYSMTPIRYGTYVAKYRAHPVEVPEDSTLKVLAGLASETDAMRLALEETLRTRDVHFDIQVQLRTSIETMPIEDATAEWPQSESPYRTVARLSLPRQEIADPQFRSDCDSLAFNVWHALAAHRPLGGINRVRRAAYALSYAWRTPEIRSSIATGDHQP